MAASEDPAAVTAAVLARTNGDVNLLRKVIDQLDQQLASWPRRPGCVWDQPQPFGQWRRARHPRATD